MLVEVVILVNLVSFQFLETEMNDLRTAIGDLKNELENHFKEKPSDNVDWFKTLMEDYLAKIDLGFVTLEKNYAIMNDLYTQVVTSFGEDPKKVTPEEFFGIFKTFIVSFDVTTLESNFRLL